MLSRFNKWFDDLREPWRLLIAIALMGWAPLVQAATFHLQLIGCVWLVVVLVITLNRLRDQ